jgi:hypothetical protein
MVKAGDSEDVIAISQVIEGGPADELGRSQCLLQLNIACLLATLTA